MGNISSCCECCTHFVQYHRFASLTTVFIVQGRRSQAYEPLLLENEREAVADLLQYLESMVSFFLIEMFH